MEVNKTQASRQMYDEEEKFRAALNDSKTKHKETISQASEENEKEIRSLSWIVFSANKRKWSKDLTSNL